jgi:hypothetical protein
MPVPGTVWVGCTTKKMVDCGVEYFEYLTKIRCRPILFKVDTCVVCGFVLRLNFAEYNLDNGILKD